MVKLSVIVPVYNVEKYLKRCLDSLVNQTLKDIEIIIVNDGSTDSSPTICKEYLKKYSNITYISQKNQGLSAARNSGVEVAKGEYLGFVDSDDFVKLDMFEFLYNNAIQNHADISCCGHETYYDDGSTELKSKKGIKKIYNKEEALDYYLMQDYFDLQTWNKIYKKSLFKDIRFPVGKIYEDIPTIYKLIYLSNSLYYDSTPKYFYYKRKNSISNLSFHKDTLKIIEYVDDYVDFCKGKLKHPKNIYIGQIRWYLVVLNKMILANQVDYDLVKKIKKLINKHIILLIFTNKISLSRKLQIFTFKISFPLYKSIYLKLQ